MKILMLLILTLISCNQIQDDNGKFLLVTKTKFVENLAYGSLFKDVFTSDTAKDIIEVEKTKTVEKIKFVDKNKVSYDKRECLKKKTSVKNGVNTNLQFSVNSVISDYESFSGNIGLKWNEIHDSDYKIQIGSCPYTFLDKDVINFHSYLNIKSSETYTINLIATKNNESFTITQYINSFPSVPTNITTSVSNNSLTIKWDKSKDRDGTIKDYNVSLMGENKIISKKVDGRYNEVTFHNLTYSINQRVLYMYARDNLGARSKTLMKNYILKK